MSNAKTSFHDVLEMAVNAGASDVHIKEFSPVAVRIDGKMVYSDFVANTEFVHSLLDQVTSPKQQAVLEEEGDLDISHREEGVGRFRVNIHRQRTYTAVTLRYVKNEIRSFEELGLPPVLREISKESRGIVVITGTTGSGKSTTLAAMLDYINETRTEHVITIEDPIEYEFEDKKSFFEQREVGIDTISFNSALKHAMRQDPDIIMVGEMRDRISFEAALQAKLIKIYIIHDCAVHDDNCLIIALCLNLIKGFIGSGQTVSDTLAFRYMGIHKCWIINIINYGKLFGIFFYHFIIMMTLSYSVMDFFDTIQTDNLNFLILFLCDFFRCLARTCHLAAINFRQFQSC